MGELQAETIHEMDTRSLSPVASKSGMNFHIHPLSSSFETPSSYPSVYSTPHSPPLAPATQSPSHSYQGQSPAPSPPLPYAVIPPYTPQTLNQQFGPAPTRHTYSPNGYRPSSPQHQYSPPPPQEYFRPPPQENTPYTHSPEVQPPTNPDSTTNIRRREVGSVSSSPGPTPGAGPVPT